MAVADPVRHKKVFELTDKLDAICKGYEAHQVKDACLTLLTWYIASFNMDHERYIDAIAFSLKETVKIQLLADAKTSDIPS